MFYYIKDNLDFDQLIWEFGTDENPDWVHVSYVDADSNRKRCLQAIKENGKTKYIDISEILNYFMGKIAYATTINSLSLNPAGSTRIKA